MIVIKPHGDKAPAERRRRKRGEAGFSLVEVLLSVALITIIGVGILAALDGANRVTLTTDVRQTASNLAETQMEYVKSQGYATAYDPAPIPSFYAGYSVAIDTAPLQDNNIQKITVTVSRDDKVAANLEGYKVR